MELLARWKRPAYLRSKGEKKHRLGIDEGATRVFGKKMSGGELVLERGGWKNKDMQAARKRRIAARDEKGGRLGPMISKRNKAEKKVSSSIEIGKKKEC